MINVLLNYYNFDEPWAFETLKPLIYGKKTLILPLAFRPTQAWDMQSWLSIYGPNGEKYKAITSPFETYGICGDKLNWLNCFDTDADFIEQINAAEVLFFTGGMPERAIDWLDKLGLTEAVKGFGGVVMGASAGAMLQLERYHITPDEDYASYGLWQGLGLVKGLDLEVHFLDTELQNNCTQRAVVELDVPVYQMWHEGGLLVENNTVTVMGQVRQISK